MSEHLPPLPALRAFIALAKLGSVNAAAQSLHVTHGAVSHQIKFLEELLGIALVVRKGRQLSLTNEGRSYAYRVRQALDDIAQATQTLKNKPAHHRLVLSVLPSFAMYWLIPRLPHLIRSFPGLDLSIQSSMSFVDFQDPSLDCAIRFGHGQWPDVHCDLLMGDSVVLVAAATHPAACKGLSVQQIMQHPFLHAGEHWSTWLNAAGLDIPTPTAYLQFSDSTHLVEAVKQGMGIALTRLSLVQGLLRDGSLVQLLPTTVPHTSSYYLVYPHRLVGARKIVVFKQWLLSQT